MIYDNYYKSESAFFPSTIEPADRELRFFRDWSLWVGGDGVKIDVGLVEYGNWYFTFSARNVSSTKKIDECQLTQL